MDISRQAERQGNRRAGRQAGRWRSDPTSEFRPGFVHVAGLGARPCAAHQRDRVAAPIAGPRCLLRGAVDSVASGALVGAGVTLHLLLLCICCSAFAALHGILLPLHSLLCTAFCCSAFAALHFAAPHLLLCICCSAFLLFCIAFCCSAALHLLLCICSAFAALLCTAFRCSALHLLLCSAFVALHFASLHFDFAFLLPAFCFLLFSSR